LKIKARFDKDIFKFLNIEISPDEMKRLPEKLIGKPIMMDGEQIGKVISAEYFDGVIEFIGKFEANI